MVTASLDSGADVLLLGMQIPPNYGQRYGSAFHAIFHNLAAEHDVPLVPFLLDGIATNDALMQRDGIHPTAAAQPMLLDNLWPVLEPLLDGHAEQLSTTTSADPIESAAEG